MNRREFLAGVGASMLLERVAFGLSVAQANLPAGPAFDVAITFDNTYPFDTKDSTFSEDEKGVVDEAVRRWRAVWATDDFKTQLVNHKLDRTQGLSNLQVYEKIMSANPKHANYALTADPKHSETAITSGSITRLQQLWLDGSKGAPINRLVNTLAHEYTHTTEGGSFTHPYYQRIFGKNSVPIVVGDITESIADKMFPAS